MENINSLVKNIKANKEKLKKDVLTKSLSIIIDPKDIYNNIIKDNEDSSQKEISLNKSVVETSIQKTKSSKKKKRQK